MVDFHSKLRGRIQAVGNNICAGIDPVASKIPGQGLVLERVRKYYLDMLEAWAKARVLPAAVKPNSAYFENLGPGGIDLLIELTRVSQALGMIVILDAKRGDIGTSSTAYAQAAFNVIQSDAVTVAPYMGKDSVSPFQKVAQSNAKGQGAYVLVRTSNLGAEDFQEKMVQEGDTLKPMYYFVAVKLAQWQKEKVGTEPYQSLGAVVGATNPIQLKELVLLWKNLGVTVPLLIPGVAVKGVSGGQSGSLTDVLKTLKETGSTEYHLINSSSGINYAYEKYSSLSPAEASLRVLQELIEENGEALK